MIPDHHPVYSSVLLELPSDVFSTVVTSWSTDEQQHYQEVYKTFTPCFVNDLCWSLPLSISYSVSESCVWWSWSMYCVMLTLMILFVWFGSQIKLSSVFSSFEHRFLPVTCGSLINGQSVMKSPSLWEITVPRCRKIIISGLFVISKRDFIKLLFRGLDDVRHLILSSTSPKVKRWCSFMILEFFDFMSEVCSSSWVILIQQLDCLFNGMIPLFHHSNVGISSSWVIM